MEEGRTEPSFYVDRRDPKAGVLLSPMFRLFLLFFLYLPPVCGQSVFMTPTHTHTLSHTLALLYSITAPHIPPLLLSLCSN